MKKRVLLLMALAPLWVKAQQITGVTPHPVSLQLQAGTQGVGADVRYGLQEKLSLRAGASFIPVNTSSNLSVSGFTTDYTADVKLFNLHLLADYAPFSSMKGLRLVAGGAYLYKADGGLVLTPTGNYNFGNYALTGADVGVLNMDVTWKGVAPYIGLGLFKSFPNHFFNFNLDLGTYYLSSPSTHITGTNMLNGNYQLEPQINENMKDYRWLPVLQLNFNFRLK